MGSNNIWLTGKPEAPVVRHRYGNPVGRTFLLEKVKPVSTISGETESRDTIDTCRRGGNNAAENRNGVISIFTN